MQVAGLVKDDEGRFHRAQVIHQVIVHVRVAPLAVHAELGGDLAHQLQLGLHLRAVDVHGVPVVLHVIPCRERLADVRDVAQDGRKARLLRELQLGGDILERGGLGGLPLHVGAEAHAQPPGDAYPCALAQGFVRLAVLDGTVHRGADAEGGGVFRVARIVRAVGGYRSQNLLFLRFCNHNSNAVLMLF